MSIDAHSTRAHSPRTIVGEPEVVEDARLAETSEAWLRLKAAATAIQRLQVKDGSIPAAVGESPTVLCRSYVCASTGGDGAVMSA